MGARCDVGRDIVERYDDVGVFGALQRALDTELLYVICGLTDPRCVAHDHFIPS